MGPDAVDMLGRIVRKSARLLVSRGLTLRPTTRARAEREYHAGAEGQDVLAIDALRPADAHEACQTDDPSHFTQIHMAPLPNVPAPQRKVVPQGVCKDFYETGYCRFGDGCAYSHVRAVDM